MDIDVRENDNPSPPNLTHLKCDKNIKVTLDANEIAGTHPITHRERRPYFSHNEETGGVPNAADHAHMTSPRATIHKTGASGETHLPMETNPADIIIKKRAFLSDFKVPLSSPKS